MRNLLSDRIEASLSESELYDVGVALISILGSGVTAASVAKKVWLDFGLRAKVANFANSWKDSEGIDAHLMHYGTSVAELKEMGITISVQHMPDGSKYFTVWYGDDSINCDYEYLGRAVTHLERRHQLRRKLW